VLLNIKQASVEHISAGSSWIYGIIGTAATVCILIALAMFATARQNRHYFPV
ncbi:unnamed protein product, partial [Allacma fusca]